MTNDVSKTIEIKNGRNWNADFTTHDATEIYTSLTNDLIAKKINQRNYIKSIKRTPLYNGTQKITVDYGDGCRAIYIIADH